MALALASDRNHIQQSQAHRLEYEIRFHPRQAEDRKTKRHGRVLGKHFALGPNIRKRLKLSRRRLHVFLQPINLPTLGLYLFFEFRAFLQQTVTA